MTEDLENQGSMLMPRYNSRLKAGTAQGFKNVRFAGKNDGTKQGHSLQQLDSNTDYKPSEHISDGYIKKIRRPSLSGKPKEQKKVPLVSSHSRQVIFKPNAGSKQPKKGDKAHIAIPVPAPTSLHDHEFSPMDVDAPLVRIRNRMKRVPKDVVDIDGINDPLKCSVYAQDICDYLQAVERRFTFPNNYLHSKKDITPNMRTVLVDWIIQVQVHQELNHNTLHLCVALIDRLMVKVSIPLPKLQLLGVTTLLIASKYHERFPPEIDMLCHLTDNTYMCDQIIQMERIVLQKLKFDLNAPCPFIFLDRYMMVNPCEKTPIIKSMAMYFLDLSLVEMSFVYFVSSLKAASAIYVSRDLMGCDVLWDKSFAHYTKYSERDLQDCAKEMRRLMAMARKSPQTGAHTKYSHSHFHGVSSHPSLMHLSIRPTELWPAKEADQGNNGMDIIDKTG